jgi:outer membrane protein assembly factor BamB
MAMPLLTLAQDPAIMWQFDMSDMAFGQAAAADVDNDGLLEVTFSTYRNDGVLYMLNGEDGSTLWEADAGGCADAAPLIYDVDQDGDLEVVLAGSCNPTTYCFDADSGFIQWQTPMRGSDSPIVTGDIDNDGKPEILHGEFGGYVLCLNGEDGSVVWELEVDVDSWIQTAPTFLDIDRDGQLDFIIATWSFYDNHIIAAYRGNDAGELWVSEVPDDVIYHGVSYGDMDNDGTVELVLGDYSGQVHCLNAADGTEKWSYELPSSPLYVGAPTSMGDINNDGFLEVVFNDWYRLGALDHNGDLLWVYNIPGYGQSFRGAALADVNEDAYMDVTFCSSEGTVISLNGLDGSLIRSIDLQADFGMNFGAEHGPLVADFNNDGVLDVFAAGGHAEYPAIENNYGAAYMISWGAGNGPDWAMFQRDYRRTACVCNDSLLQTTEPVAIAMELTVPDISVYPTLFVRELLLVGKEALPPLELSLYNISGLLLYSQAFTGGDKKVIVTLPELPPAAYILRIQTAAGQSEQLLFRQ